MVAPTSPSPSLNTLAIDIGGTGLKASVLDLAGHMEHDRVRTDTPYPLSPQKLVMELQKLVKDLPPFDRVSVGFPGMVRDGKILSAPHFVSPSGPGGKPEPKLVRAWNEFDLAAAMEEVTGKPAKVANDADVQGSAVIQGDGFELVVTLGTGVGTAFFMNGFLLPHFEFAHTPYDKHGSYNDALGDAARKRIGNKKWVKRAIEAIEVLRALTFFDHCYVGGGNSARLGSDLPDRVTVVSNDAGILGGIKLWDATEHAASGAPTAGKAPLAATIVAKRATARGARTTRRGTAPTTTAKAAPSRAAATKATTVRSRKAAGPTRLPGTTEPGSGD